MLKKAFLWEAFAVELVRTSNPSGTRLAYGPKGWREVSRRAGTRLATCALENSDPSARQDNAGH